MILTLTLTFPSSSESAVGKLLEALAEVAEVEPHIEAKKIDTSTPRFAQ